MADEQKIKEILERGVEDIIVKEHLEAALRSGKKLRVKFGIDPTGPKIHLGRAIPLRKLRVFQELGHTIVLIIGDFTATIGDPSDKLSKRPILTEQQIGENMRTYEQQLGKILDIKRAEIRYNSEWLGALTFREVAQLADSFSLQQMVARRNFKERIGKGEEVSMREMLYPLMQGYDSIAVDADVEVGGFDQLFNLKAGRAIQKQYGKPEQDVLTTQMLEGTDGRKMSTSWGNIIAINDTPYEMRSKILDIHDDLILKYFWLCTDVSQEELDEYQKRMTEGANPQDIKEELAKMIITIYHSKEAAEKVEIDFPEIRPGSSISLKEALIMSGASSTATIAKNLVELGGVKVNGVVQTDWNRILEGKGEEVQYGKGKKFKVLRKS